VRRLLSLVRHMKDSGGSAPSTYVTPRRRRKPGGTDFTNKRSRKRRELRRKSKSKGNLLSAPLKVRGAGLPVAIKFCSIRKLILESIVEAEDEVLEDTAVEHEEHEVISSGEKHLEMTEELGFNCSPTLETPQPSFGFKECSTRGTDSQSSDHAHTDVVSFIIHKFENAKCKLCILVELYLVRINVFAAGSLFYCLE
jgi:hypothetical protein